MRRAVIVKFSMVNLHERYYFSSRGLPKIHARRDVVDQNVLLRDFPKMLFRSNVQSKFLKINSSARTYDGSIWSS
jgi:hypothetical protein